MENSDYLQQLDAKLEAARKRVKQGREVKALREAAPTLFEIIDAEITLSVNKMTQPTPLSYETYLSTHGQVVGFIRIRDLLNAKEVEAVVAAEEATAIENNLKQLKDDQKQKQG